MPRHFHIDSWLHNCVQDNWSQHSFLGPWRTSTCWPQLRLYRFPTGTHSPQWILSVPRKPHGLSGTFASVLLFTWINTPFSLYLGNYCLSFNSQLGHKLLRKLWLLWPISGAHSSSHNSLSFQTTKLNMPVWSRIVSPTKFKVFECQGISYPIVLYIPGIE